MSGSIPPPSIGSGAARVTLKTKDKVRTREPGKSEFYRRDRPEERQQPVRDESRLSKENQQAETTTSLSRRSHSREQSEGPVLSERESSIPSLQQTDSMPIVSRNGVLGVAQNYTTPARPHVTSLLDSYTSKEKTGGSRSLQLPLAPGGAESALSSSLLAPSSTLAAMSKASAERMKGLIIPAKAAPAVDAITSIMIEFGIHCFMTASLLRQEENAKIELDRQVRNDERNRKDYRGYHALVEQGKEARRQAHADHDTSVAKASTARTELAEYARGAAYKLLDLTGHSETERVLKTVKDLSFKVQTLREAISDHAVKSELGLQAAQRAEQNLEPLQRLPSRLETVIQSIDALRSEVGDMKEGHHDLATTNASTAEKLAKVEAGLAVLIQQNFMDKIESKVSNSAFEGHTATLHDIDNRLSKLEDTTDTHHHMTEQQPHDDESTKMTHNHSISKLQEEVRSVQSVLDHVQLQVSTQYHDMEDGERAFKSLRSAVDTITEHVGLDPMSQVHDDPKDSFDTRVEIAIHKYLLEVANNKASQKLVSKQLLDTPGENSDQAEDVDGLAARLWSLEQARMKDFDSLAHDIAIIQARFDSLGTSNRSTDREATGKLEDIATRVAATEGLCAASRATVDNVLDRTSKIEQDLAPYRNTINESLKAATDLQMRFESHLQSLNANDVGIRLDKHVASYNAQQAMVDRYLATADRTRLDVLAQGQTLRGMNSRFNNITTDHVVKCMVKQMSAMYPDVANAQQEIRKSRDDQAAERVEIGKLRLEINALRESLEKSEEVKETVEQCRNNLSQISKEHEEIQAEQAELRKAHKRSDANYEKLVTDVTGARDQIEEDVQAAQRTVDKLGEIVSSLPRTESWRKVLLVNPATGKGAKQQSTANDATTSTTPRDLSETGEKSDSYSLKQKSHTTQGKSLQTGSATTPHSQGISTPPNAASSSQTDLPIIDLEKWTRPVPSLVRDARIKNEGVSESDRPNKKPRHKRKRKIADLTRAPDSDGENDEDYVGPKKKQI